MQVEFYLAGEITQVIDSTLGPLCLWQCLLVFLAQLSGARVSLADCLGPNCPEPKLSRTGSVPDVMQINIIIWIMRTNVQNYGADTENNSHCILSVDINNVLISCWVWPHCLLQVKYVFPFHQK